MLWQDLDTQSEADNIRKSRSAYINHDSLFSKVVKGKRGIDTAPVKFNRASNAVHAAS